MRGLHGEGLGGVLYPQVREDRTGIGPAGQGGGKKEYQGNKYLGSFHRRSDLILPKLGKNVLLFLKNDYFRGRKNK